MDENKKSQKPKVSLISVLDRRRGIGKNGKPLFDLPEHRAHLESITNQHTVIMGYNTYQSLGRALPGHRNIVLSTRIRLLHDAKICRDINEVLKAAQSEDKVFVIGGENVFKQFLPMANTLYLTLVDAEVSADKFFPDFSEFANIEELGEGKNDELSFRFLKLTK